MNEIQKEIMEKVKEGVNKNNVYILEEAFLNSIQQNENKILKNILEKTHLCYDYLEHNVELYIKAIKNSVSYSNTEALYILPTLDLELDENHFYSIDEVFNQVVANDNVEAFNALIGHDSFNTPSLQLLAVKCSSQKMIDRLLEYQGSYLDYHEFTVKDVIDTENLETISKYLAFNTGSFLDLIEEMKNQGDKNIASKFIDISEELFQSKIFNEIANKNYSNGKDIEKITLDFFTKNFPEEYNSFKHKKIIKQNVMNF